MEEKVITWQFVGQSCINHSFCKDEKEFYSVMEKRYSVKKDQIKILKIEIWNEANK